MYDSIGTPPKAIFDVDGFIQETAPTYLSSHDIDRIAILERNAAISRYGPMGVGGVYCNQHQGHYPSGLQWRC